MITTSTGAKKLESSDNWREIFPNPGTSAAGAHNASVDAQDRIQAEVAPIINGKRCSLGAASGEYVLLRNSTIAGKTDGAYVAAKAIPANTDLDSTYLGSPITGGMVNELNNNITNNTAKYLSNNSVYMSIQEAIAPGGTYTCPYDALYMLSCGSDTAGVAAEISINGGVIANTNTTDSVCTPVYLKAGSVLTMRNRAGQSYRIRGYWR